MKPREMERKNMRRKKAEKKARRGGKGRKEGRKHQGDEINVEKKQRVFLNVGKPGRRKGTRVGTHEQDLARRQSPHVGFLMR